MKHIKSLNQLANGRNKFAIIKIDETEYWQDDIAKAAGKIYGVYLVDLTQPTHCCELAVSFPAENIKNFFENVEGLDDDTIFEYEYGNDNLRQDYMYLRGSSICEVAKLYVEKDKEEVMEYESGNPTVC